MFNVFKKAYLCSKHSESATTVRDRDMVQVITIYKDMFFKSNFSKIH